ncbi:MAG: prtrc system protein e [Bacteroidota bacterium]
MTTNFFEALNVVANSGAWIITIKSAPPDRLLVSVLFNNEKTGDTAAKLVPPILLKGTVKEMNEGFFNAIETPVKKTAELFLNMEQYNTAQEEARLNSQKERDKEQKNKKEKDSGNKKYEAAMKKVTDLELAGKFREAHGALPKIADFPDYEEEINEKKEELAEQFEAPSLFDEPAK